MTTRYVGIGGNDASDGLSWANRKLTLNGAEDTPVASGDIVYVGPGTYREMLTVDVSGASMITYIGDVSGEHTDGVGGVVRITGSNNDTTGTRANCIVASSKNYRTFKGFTFDLTTGHNISNTTGDNWTIEDCTFAYGDTTADAGFYVSNTTPDTIVVRRSIFMGGYGVQIYSASDVTASGCLTENCLFIGCNRGFYDENIDGWVIKNCAFLGCGGRGLSCNSLATSTSITVNNCIFAYNAQAIWTSVVGEISDDYNCRFVNVAADNNVTPGANSVAYPPGLSLPMLLDGIKFPWRFGELAPWSPVKRIAGATGSSTDDLYGIERPVTNNKQSWGAIQYTGAIRVTGTTQGLSAASISLPDAGEQFLMRFPSTAVSTVVSVFCYREADYVGTNPQMILRQPGQSDITVTDTGSVSAWNQLSYTLTPSATPPYIEIWIKSLNTAVSGSYAAYWDTLSVS